MSDYNDRRRITCLRVAGAAGHSTRESDPSSRHVLPEWGQAALDPRMEDARGG